ncbi:syncoilin-like [Arapaima gigas]
MFSYETTFFIRPVMSQVESTPDAAGSHDHDEKLSCEDETEFAEIDSEADTESPKLHALRIEEDVNELGTSLQGCVDDVGMQTACSLDDLSTQFEECLEEVEVLLRECGGGVDPHLEGCLEAMSSELEEYSHGLTEQLSRDLPRVGQERGDGSIGELGLQFEACITEVGVLEQHRDKLVQELLQMLEPMEQEARGLRAELGEAWRRLTQVELERRSLREEAQKIKMKLFGIIRECTQSRISQAMLQRDLEQSAVTQEKLQAEVLRLTEEAAKLQLDQQNQLNDLQSLVSVADLSETPSDMSRCLEASRDFSRQLQSCVKEVEERYEPQLQALLTRRDAGAEAVRRSREEGRQMRARLGPLREEAQKLALQRACLQERLELMHQEREQNTKQHRETLDALEESSRKLKTELQVQVRKNKELETLKENREKELRLYRSDAEVQGKGDPAVVKEKT